MHVLFKSGGDLAPLHGHVFPTTFMYDVSALALVACMYIIGPVKLACNCIALHVCIIIILHVIRLIYL